MHRILIFVFSIGTVMLLASAHPADNGQIDAALLRSYENSVFEDQALSLGDLRFHGPAPAVAAERPTHAEQYILFGVRSSSTPGGGPMQPWSQLVYSFARNYHRKHATVPAALSEDLVRAEFAGYTAADPAMLEAQIQALRSPITGEWPRLDVREFSAGDCLIRPLSQTEIDHLAARSVYYRKLFREHQALNPASGGYEPVELHDQPFYLRVYGQSGPLVQMVQYTLSFD